MFSLFTEMTCLEFTSNGLRVQELTQNLPLVADGSEFGENIYSLLYDCSHFFFYTQKQNVILYGEEDGSAVKSRVFKFSFQHPYGTAYNYL